MEHWRRKKVRIMEDNWIPGFSAGMYRPVDPLPANAKIECLLDHDNQCWDVNKVQGCFGSRVRSDFADSHKPDG
jgi:hypothetical protein